jgi:hypothetical protein
MVQPRRRDLRIAVLAVVSLGLVVGAVKLTNDTNDPAPTGAAADRPTPEASPSTSPTSSPTMNPAIAELTPAAAPGTGPLGLKWSWAQPGTFPYIADAAGGWAFAEVEWCDVQPSPGVFDWTGVDRVVRDSRALGYEPMLKLRTGQCWATHAPTHASRDTTENVTKETSTPPTDETAYLTFVRETVQRYGARGVDDYAIENEPDVANFWAAPVAAYDTMARQVADAIHQVQPDANVMDGGASSTAYGVAMAADQIDRDPQQALRTYRDYYARRIAAGVSRFPDVTGIAQLRRVLASEPALRAEETVALTVDLANSGVVDSYQLHYYEAASQLPQVLGFLDSRLQDDVPIEAWEVGAAWPGAGYDERAHADETFRLVGLLLADDVRRIVYLPVAYSAEPGKTQVFRGLTEPTGAVLPAGDGWLRLAEALTGLHAAPLLPAGGNLAGVTWQVGNRQAALVWAAHGGTVALDPDDVSEVVTPSGSVVPGVPTVGREPVLVLGSARGALTRKVGSGGY